jgi:aspartate/tyrosine/aromatic aminotransferase
MTQLLEKALTEVYKLPPEGQNAIAAVILEELEDEQRWEAAFAASEGKLAKLAQKVRSDIKEGRVKKMGFDEL